jgi:mono/diheme cytochrome c family protein
MNYKPTVGSMLGLAVLLAIPAVSRAADEGATLYKTKCSGCHGATGDGKPSVKAPALKGTTWDVDKIVHHITTGEPDSKPPHKKGITGVTESQAKAIAEFVKTLK